MKVKDPKNLKALKKGDYVYATFVGVDDEVTAVEGWLQKITDDSILIMTRNPLNGPKLEFGLWQMLSLVCMKKDMSFSREKSVTSELERLAFLLADV